MEFLDDDLDVFDILEHGIPRRAYERSNYLEEMDDLTFFKRFRLTKETVQNILPQIEDKLRLDEGRFGNNTVTPINQFLTTLRFYATGRHLSSIGDFMGMDTSPVSKIVKRTSEALALLRPFYIHMPQNDAEKIEVQRDFFQIASFPRVIGCIDGTHVRIQSPGGEDGEVYRNRKGYYSINVQLVTDAKLKIRDIVARWPGSQHDSTIFDHSRIKTRFENGKFENCVLLGDSGYALRHYLLTPLTNPRKRGEVLYNEAHVRTRNSIERTNGVFKRRFPVLAYGMRLKLQTALTIIVATAVLHNIARDMNEPEEPPIDFDAQELNYMIEMANIADQPNINNINENRTVYRNEIIHYFHNLPQ